jgi:Domain of unknown function (DUF4124)
MKPMLIVAGLLLSGAAAAETFKCTDAAGKITYSSTNCKELGLKDAGEVPDRINVNPAYRPPPGSQLRRPPAPAAPAEPPKPATPAEPERRCFTVQTPKGPVTRCNDKPGEDGPPPS